MKASSLPPVFAWGTVTGARAGIKVLFQCGLVALAPSTMALEMLAFAGAGLPSWLNSSTWLAVVVGWG